MKLIQLGKRKNLFAMVSDKDYPMLSKHAWSAVHITGVSHTGKVYSYGYKAGRWIGNHVKRVWMHNEIRCPGPGLEVDHRDRNTLNNTRSNLRVVPHWINCMNRRKLKNKTSKYYGVCKLKEKTRWTVYVWNRFEMRHQHIGYYDSELEAAKEYDKTVRKLYGKYARTNFK